MVLSLLALESHIRKENIGWLKMKRLHKISVKKMLKFLGKYGYRVFDRQGSHYFLIQDNTMKQLQLPERKELGQKTIETALDHAGISQEDFYASI